MKKHEKINTIQSKDTASDTGSTISDDPQDSSDDNKFKDTFVLLIDDDDILGDENTPITLVEFGEYQCTSSNKFFDETFETLKCEYIDTGKIHGVSRQCIQWCAISHYCAFRILCTKTRSVLGVS